MFTIAKSIKFMCGLIAAFTEESFPELSADRALFRMEKRGPDGEGRWREDGVFLGHRRLAIQDLDARAAQPMHSSCGRYSIVFNGEIYNYRELRAGLERVGCRFRTSSDTEVLLTLFELEGECMLNKLHGMFAFVVWDSKERKAFAARDPYGIKPLYVANTRSGLLLGSQVNALLATGLVDTTSDPVGQAGFWMLGSVPEPHTLYRDVTALRAGHCLWIKKGRVVAQRCWHDISEIWREASMLQSQLMPADQVASEVRSVLIESVDRHLVSDVPVGVFLSGGVDSGALAGLMVERGASSLLGVTVAFDEYSGTQCDEVPFARKVASHYGIRHHVRRIGRDEFLSDLPRIMTAMDQPSIDGINTWYAAKAVAEQGLKVVVSGVGGDELFFGYTSFHQLPRLVSAKRLASHFPGFSFLGKRLARLLSARSGNARWSHAIDWLDSIAGAWWLKRSSMAPATADFAMRSSSPDLFIDFSPETWISNMVGPLAKVPELALAQIESTVYLRNQLLRDSDWASMDHSVELRTPLVDAYLLAGLKKTLSQFHRFPGKTLLANAPVKALPIEIVRKKKTGFGIPVRKWITDYLGEGTSWQVEVAKNKVREKHLCSIPKN